MATDSGVSECALQRADQNRCTASRPELKVGSEQLQKDPAHTIRRGNRVAMANQSADMRSQVTVQVPVDCDIDLVSLNNHNSFSFLFFVF